MKTIVHSLMCPRCHRGMNPYDNRMRAVFSSFHDKNKKSDRYGHTVTEYPVDRVYCPECGITITVPNSNAARNKRFAPQEIESFLEPDICGPDCLCACDNTRRAIRKEYEQLKSCSIEMIRALSGCDEEKAWETLWSIVDRTVSGWFSVLQLLVILFSTIFCAVLLMSDFIIRLWAVNGPEGDDDGIERPG